MEQVEFTVKELYELRAQIAGFSPDGKTVLYPGFVNETDVCERLKLDAARVAKAIQLELDLITERRKAVQDFRFEEKAEE